MTDLMDNSDGSELLEQFLRSSALTHTSVPPPLWEKFATNTLRKVQQYFLSFYHTYGITCQKCYIHIFSLHGIYQFKLSQGSREGHCWVIKK